MARRDNERPPQFFIGPNSPNDPESLLDEARQRVRDEDELNKESTKLARRLLVAFVIILLMGCACRRSCRSFASGRLPRVRS